MLLLPLISIAGLILAAVITVIMQSLGYVPAFGLETLTLSYYLSILTDSGFLTSLAVSLKIALFSSVMASVIGTLVCAAMVSGKQSKGLLNSHNAPLTMIRIPILIPHAIVAIFMINIFSQTGILARISYALGFIDDYSEFGQILFTDSYIGVILAYLWKEIPFVAYFVFALMDGISQSLGEAAQNLGASPLKSFFQITLPLSLPSVLNAFFIIFIFALGGYELPLLLGATAPKALPVETYMSFSGPDLTDRPYSMAMNGITLMISLLFALIYLAAMKKLVRRIGGRQ